MKKYNITFSILIIVIVVLGLWLFWRDAEPSEQRAVESQARNGSSVAMTNSTSIGLSSTIEDVSVSPSANSTTKDSGNMRTFDPIDISGDILGDIEEASARGVLGAGLTIEESKWMDAQGMLAPSMNMFDRYRGVSLEELKSLAEKGDVLAAVVGAHKVGKDMLKSDDMSRLFETLSSDNKESRRQNLNNYVASPEMEQQREFLWQAVVHGSSYAAWSMAGTYADPLGGRCIKMSMCAAWTMVAWRMGDWKVVPPTPSAGGGTSTLYSALAVANRLWSELNQARADQGLSPLKLDLRPAYDKWVDMKQHPDKAVPVYPR